MATSEAILWFVTLWGQKVNLIIFKTCCMNKSAVDW